MLSVWLTQFIFGFGSSVSKLADKVKNALDALGALLVSFFTEQMSAMSAVAAYGLQLLVKSATLVSVTANLGAFILRVAVPAWIANAINSVVAWVKQYVGPLINEVRAAIDSVLHWAEAQVAHLIQDAIDLKNWAIAEFNSVIHTLNWVFDKVTQLLTDPTVLANWLLVALWNVSVTWIQQHAESIGRWALGTAIKTAIRSAGIIEDVLVEIF